MPVEKKKPMQFRFSKYQLVPYFCSVAVAEFIHQLQGWVPVQAPKEGAGKPAPKPFFCGGNSEAADNLH